MKATVYQKGHHVAEADLEPADDRCPFCHARGPRKAVLTIQNDPLVTLLECSKCFARSASRIPKPDVLTRYYAGYYDPVAKPFSIARRVLRFISGKAGARSSS